MQQSISLKRSPSGIPTEPIQGIAGQSKDVSHLRHDSILPLRLEEVCYAAGGQNLLQNLSFSIEAGTSTVILGPNGAGKSLLLRLCHGLLQPSAGRILWLGPGAARAAHRQAMVFQRPVLLRRSAAANIAYALRIHGLTLSERKNRVQQALEMAGLTPLANRYARVLSGGEQQRLALARAWALQPEVLFLDEPTANLDPAATRTVEEIIQAFHASGTKIVMTTHDLGQARRLADEVLFLHYGQLIEQSPAEQFFDRPATREAIAFIRGELLW